jgi:hypothetical protein
VLLVAAFPETDMTSLLPPDAPDDAEARIAIAVRRFLKVVSESESQQRTMLRLSLEDGGATRDLALRKGRAIGWFTDALEPARPHLGDDGIRKLVLSLRSALGIEAFVWLVDVAGLSRRQAIAQMQWTAEMLCAAALRQ